MVDIEEVKKIIEEVKDGNWGEVINLQTNPNRDDYHAELLKYVLHILDKEKILSTKVIKNETVYLVRLIRYFRGKPLNNGYYFRKEEDAKSFAEQYLKIIASFSPEEKELVAEKDEKIKIVGINLLLEENVA